MDATGFLLCYGIAVIALLVSLYALLEMQEAKDNGKYWVDLNRQLVDKIEQLEKNSKRSGIPDPFKIK